MTIRWRLKPQDPARSMALSREANVSPLVAQLLLNRGIHNAATASIFLEGRLSGLHDPETLPGAAEAADRIVRAIRDRRKIVIYGDYDVDGVCGTTVLWSCLRLAGAEAVDYYIPHRVDEGYGVNGEALARLVRDDGASLIITVDCGISALTEARLARELGAELIVTDHHTIGTELPEAAVIVHPRLPGSRYPCGDLCGAAVAFKLAWQVCKSFGDGKKASPHLRDFLVRAISLVALATVADMVPVSDENRILVRYGLAGMKGDPSVGLRALMDVSGCLDKRKLTTGNLGFGLAPRINAAGRLERARMAVDMLTTDDAAFARDVAAELDRCNSRRQELEREIVSQAHEMVKSLGSTTDRGAIVVGREGWHPGVIGIVAGRLADTYHRPAIVVALGDEVGQGSARSIPGFDLYAAIEACSEGLIGFGGHTAAAGLKLKSAGFREFADRFDLHCRGALTVEQREKVLAIDAEIPLGILTTRVVDEIENLEPHGIGNPRPVLAANGVRLLGDPKIVGAQLNHVQLRLAQGDLVVKAVGWNMADRVKKLAANSVGSFAFHASNNEWNGRRDVQLEIKDFQLEEASENGQLHPA